MKRRIKTQFNNTKQTHQNTGKEQLSLDQGSAEFREYEEDLEEINPLKPNDKEYEALKKHNSEHDDKMAVKAERASRSEVNADKRSYRLRMNKEGQFGAMKNTVMSEAAKTPDKRDDVIAKRIQEADEIVESLVYDNGVSEEGYVPKAISKYIE